jgi:hypothetical protein
MFPGDTEQKAIQAQAAALGRRIEEIKLRFWLD